MGCSHINSFAQKPGFFKKPGFLILVKPNLQENGEGIVSKNRVS